MNLIFNNNNNSFSARPEEFISLYSEYILDNEIKAVTQKLSSIVDKLKKIQAPIKIEPIKENNEIYYLEYQKQVSKNIANFFLDIEVNFLSYFPLK